MSGSRHLAVTLVPYPDKQKYCILTSKGEAVMIVSLLMGLVADLVFDSAASLRRSFGDEMDRYYQDRGFRSAPPKPTPTR